MEKKSEQEEGHNPGGKEGVWKPRDERQTGEVKRFKLLRTGAFR